MSGVIPVDLSFPQLGFLYFKQFASLVFQTVCVFGLSNSLCLSNSVLGISNSWCPWSFKQSVSMVFQTVCVLGLSNSLCPWSNSLCPWSFKQFVSLVFQTVCVPGLSDSVCPWSFKQLVSMVFQTICVHGLSNNLCPWSFKQFVSLVFQFVSMVFQTICVPGLSNSLWKIRKRLQCIKQKHSHTHQQPANPPKNKGTHRPATVQIHLPSGMWIWYKSMKLFLHEKAMPSPIHVFFFLSFFYFFYVICLQMKLHWYFVSLVQIRL